jgi:hypothetical protein
MPIQRCRDDDGNGLIDAEDPACCTAEPLNVTQARFRPGKSTLRVDATLADGTFAGLDPRQQTVRLQIRTAEGEQVCCAISQEQSDRHYTSRPSGASIEAWGPVRDRAVDAGERPAVSGIVVRRGGPGRLRSRGRADRARLRRGRVQAGGGANRGVGTPCSAPFTS